jgi:hypothetical protein
MPHTYAQLADDVDALSRDVPSWAQHGPKYPPLNLQGRQLIALRHADGWAKLQTLPEGVDPQTLAVDGWEVIA